MDRELTMEEILELAEKTVLLKHYNEVKTLASDLVIRQTLSILKRSQASAS